MSGATDLDFDEQSEFHDDPADIAQANISEVELVDLRGKLKKVELETSLMRVALEPFAIVGQVFCEGDDPTLTGAADNVVLENNPITVGALRRAFRCYDAIASDDPTAITGE